MDQCLLWQKLDRNEKKMYLPYQHKNLNPNPNPQTEIGHFSLHALILIYTRVEND